MTEVVRCNFQIVIKETILDEFLSLIVHLLALGGDMAMFLMKIAIGLALDLTDVFRCMLPEVHFLKLFILTPFQGHWANLEKANKAHEPP